jgi:hypothetical protein
LDFELPQRSIAHAASGEDFMKFPHRAGKNFLRAAGKNFGPPSGVGIHYAFS